ncbi:palmitoyltransferase ZDHHC16 [Dendroctonus ponderosae]|uniref:Palmitoyltransferase n=1 Tax=Dendroctonus ponderosae TaxID=77166 RepID=A0AAR5PVI7_DENPD|nr:palmitoyltransferase ZDHHC16 [Dendroctonus ponderosae]
MAALSMIAWYSWPFRTIKLICFAVQSLVTKCRLTYLTLTYNHFLDASYMADVCMGPMFWLVDNFTNTIGVLLVAGVIGLTASTVLIAYWIGIPHWWNKSPYICVCLVIVGHWILLNIIFNYYMACTVLPGYPPEGELIAEAVSICKKCIAPKPPRTHHCSVCNRCILKMDHHCPWLNNCVGHKNHRYFYLYMVFMVLGVFFLILCGWEIAYPIIFLGINANNDEPELEGHSVQINKSGAFIPVTDTIMLNASFLTEAAVESTTQFRRKCIMYMTFLNVGVCVALGYLSAMHGQMITHNETSIETHINKTESLRLKCLGTQYVNPYDLGPRNNWKQFFNFNRNSKHWTQLLLPSIYHPFGDGLSWPTIDTEEIYDKEFDCQQEEQSKFYTFEKCTPLYALQMGDYSQLV